METKCLIIFNLLFVIINAELQKSPLFECRSIQALPNRCNFQDLSSKITVDDFLTFLEQLDLQLSETFKSIIQDLNISKGEIKVNLIKFAFNLPENFKQIFITILENSVKNAKMIESEFDKSIENASADAKVVYPQIKKIYKNDNITVPEECQQINTIINASPATVISELENIFGHLINCIPNLPISIHQNIKIQSSPESPSIGNNPPFDFQKGLIIPENQIPNNFDLNQIFGSLNNNNLNNNLGIPNPLNNNGMDLISTFNEVISLVKNLNNLINGLQSLNNLNGLLNIPNGLNLGSLLPPSNNNNNNNVNLPNPNNILSNFNWNNLFTPNNNNIKQTVNYPNYISPAVDTRNSMYQNNPNFRYPIYANYPFPYST